jgi:hypothetical protein
MNHNANSLTIVSRRRWVRLSVALGFLLALVIAGFFSNKVTMRKCEHQVARWLKNDVMRGEKFYVLPHDATPATLMIFDDVGAVYKIYRDTGADFDGLPWSYVRPAQSVAPFIVTVEWGWQLGPLYGSGHTRRFLCIFGFAIPLGDSSGGWAS